MAVVYHISDKKKIDTRYFECKIYTAFLILFYLETVLFSSLSVDTRNRHKHILGEDL
jgi:hypothetical protein